MDNKTPQTIDLRPVTKRRNKFPIRKIIGSVFFIVALTLLIIANYPYLEFLSHKFSKSPQTNNNLQGVIAGTSDQKNTEENSQQYFASFTHEDKEHTEEKETPNFKPNDLIGYLYINTTQLNLDLPVVEGVEFENLQNGVGHQPGTSLPNPQTGNVVIAGHSWYPGDNPHFTAFYDLEKLEIGAYATLYYQNKKFTYRINNREIVSPEQTEILDSTQDPTLTIYTCYPVRTNLKRLVYTAVLTSVEDA